MVVRRFGCEIQAAVVDCVGYGRIVMMAHA
jgi:hypothetical protein